MCGIAGVFSLTGVAKKYEANLDSALQALAKRGPDSHGKYFHGRVGLGHTRLSIIDVSDAGAQPMFDASGRYCIIYNGEIYNYRELRKELDSLKVKLKSQTDTEVVLNLYILHKEKCLDLINGFFAFAIYDNVEGSLFIARDRIGIKPLLFYQDQEKIIFASEMKALLAFPVIKKLDLTSLFMYLQLNYIPAPSSIFRHVKKLKPGHYLRIAEDGSMNIHRYYMINYHPAGRNGAKPGYEDSKAKLRELLNASVKKRMIADVPLGAFLSGGIDSSVIVSLAAQHTAKLNTFSIGFKDEPYFDETRYAEMVAKKYNTNHTAFSLTNRDLFDNLFDMLDYIDEPFADSSAMAVYILSRQTKTKVTVALSGDGADELFGGYNKHLAETRVKNAPVLNFLVRMNRPFFSLLPQSRNSAVSNMARQLSRYAEGMNLDTEERYWRWCSFINEQEAAGLLNVFDEPVENTEEYVARKNSFLTYYKRDGTINDTLYSDMQLVLPNDMLMKVDLMSMANSLEVRVPYLDHELVNYVFTLPADFKIRGGARKQILIDTFKNDLPPELLKRKKQGFEVPLLKWFRGDLKNLITSELLETSRIRNQGIFNAEYVEGLKRKLFSSSPVEAVAQVWGLLVFQYWHRKHLE